MATLSDPDGDTGQLPEPRLRQGLRGQRRTVDGGTLFLDEVVEMATHLQVRLLREAVRRPPVDDRLCAGRSRRLSS